MGAHGEPGLQQISPVPSPEALVSQMLDLVVNTGDQDRAFVPFSEDGLATDREVVLLMNSLGSTSDEVLAAFAEKCITCLEDHRFHVRRLTLGPLVTSLKLSGFGITVWRLPPPQGETLSRNVALQLWDTPVPDVLAWRQ